MPDKKIACQSKFHAQLQMKITRQLLNQLSWLLEQKPTLAGFEPTRDKPNGFQVHRLNHSATVSRTQGMCSMILKLLQIGQLDHSTSKNCHQDPMSRWIRDCKLTMTAHINSELILYCPPEKHRTRSISPAQ